MGGGRRLGALGFLSKMFKAVLLVVESKLPLQG